MLPIAHGTLENSSSAARKVSPPRAPRKNKYILWKMVHSGVSGPRCRSDLRFPPQLYFCWWLLPFYDLAEWEWVQSWRLNSRNAIYKWNALLEAYHRPLIWASLRLYFCIWVGYAVPHIRQQPLTSFTLVSCLYTSTSYTGHGKVNLHNKVNLNTPLLTTSAVFLILLLSK